MRYIRWTLSGLTVLLVLLSGCSSQNQYGIPPLSSKDAASMNSEHAAFERGEDPPYTPSTRFAAGQMCESQGNIPGAIEQYKQAVLLDGKHVTSLYRLGVLYAQVKNYNEAITIWKKYLEAVSDDPTAYSNLGFCYELAGRLTDAELTYKAGIQRMPNNEPCQINYGLMLARNARPTEALVHLQAVLTPSQVHYNMGSVYEQIGRKDQARIEYRKALQLDPTISDAKVRMAALGMD